MPTAAQVVARSVGRVPLEPDSCSAGRWDLRGVTVIGSLAATGDDGLVVAVARGADALVAVPPDDQVCIRALDALARLGSVIDWRDEAVLGLADHQVELLVRMADGAGPETAARALGVSQRTGYRWLASARTALGADSVDEAVRRVSRLQTALRSPQPGP